MSQAKPSARKPALDPSTLEPRTGSSYPEPFRAAVASREKRALGDALGLTNFGVNLVRLPPGCASSQRHWHSQEDEFVYVLDGEVTLVSDTGPQVLSAGMAAGFPAGREDGHQLVNRSDRDALYLEVGDRKSDDEVIYPDVDLHLRTVDGKYQFQHKDGTPY
ncbi:MAG TPA: cupin domain-containing protein [Kiloniellales bacterium]